MPISPKPPPGPITTAGFAPQPCRSAAGSFAPAAAIRPPAPRSPVGADETASVELRLGGLRLEGEIRIGDRPASGGNLVLSTEGARGDGVVVMVQTDADQRRFFGIDRAAGRHRRRRGRQIRRRWDFPRYLHRLVHPTRKGRLARRSGVGHPPDRAPPLSDPVLRCRSRRYRRRSRRAAGRGCGGLRPVAGRSPSGQRLQRRRRRVRLHRVGSRRGPRRRDPRRVRRRRAGRDRSERRRSRRTGSPSN